MVTKIQYHCDEDYSPIVTKFQLHSDEGKYEVVFPVVSSIVMYKSYVFF